MSDQLLLSVRNLRVDFSTPYGTVNAVRGVGFDLDRNETLALVGESGSGKSVTALSIPRLLPYPQASHPSGTISYLGRDLLTASPDELRALRGNRISMVFQEPMTSLNPLHKVGRQVEEALLVHGLASPERARRRTMELMELAGINDPWTLCERFPHELSGGQRQRVMIAAAIANEPDLLIADEPTTALDVTIQAQILRLLKELQARFSMALLLITHDLGIVEKISDRVAVMTEGLIVEEGTVDKVFSLPSHPYTRALLGAEPKGTPPQRSAAGATMLETKDLKVWFPVKTGLFRRTTGYVKAVDGVTLKVPRGRTLGVVGESGSGKTTLALAVARLIESRGGISLAGSPIDGLAGRSLRPLRKRVQIVFQDPYGSLSPRMSVKNIIEEGLSVHRPQASEAERDRLVVKVMEEVGLDPEARHRYPHEFSGGQRQRVAIARSLVLEPDVLILDEPTSALDRSVQARMVDLLRELQERLGLTYIFISHDLKVVRALSDRMAVMKDGVVVEEGETERLFIRPDHPYTRSLVNAAFMKEV